MATLYSGSIGTKRYPDGWKWYFTITSREDANNYYVDIALYLQGTWDFPLDLMQNDIWWSLNFDGTSYEIFRVYLSNGQYQTLSANTKYGNKTVTKTYSKTNSSQPKSVSFNVFGSATEFTNMLGTENSGSVSFTISSGYKAPSGFSITATESTPTTITVKANWTNGSKTSTATIKIGDNTKTISSSGGTVVIGSLNPNTNYTISGTLSDGTTTLNATTTKRTRHASLTGLKVNLVDSWYWYLKINCSYNYTGTISKYEFAIGDQEYRTVDTNSHERGTVNESNTGKLSYNTDYPCKVRLTDEYGRTYEASATFKTLDERCIYVNGELREVKLIQPNGTVKYITPNLLSVIKSDGTVVNMNKVINNDNRTEH